MIEVRTYEGDAEDLSHFYQKVWRGDYEGKMMLPLWTPSFFDWQFLADRPGGRDYLVAAYDGSKLVGCLLAESFPFRHYGSEVKATMGSMLTIDPEYRKEGVVLKILLEQRRRHLERGDAFMLGYAYSGAKESMGPKFWLNLPYATIVNKLGLWIRVFDHRTVACVDVSKRDAIAVSILGLLQRSPRKPHNLDGIRGYQNDDLPQCLSLAHGLLDDVDTGYLWSASRLAHQLRYKDVPRTVIAEKHGKITGFVNYFSFDFLGRGAIRTGLIDIVAFGMMHHQDRKRLIAAALDQMKNEGIKGALLLRLPCYPIQALLACGFIPMPSDLYVICIRMNPKFNPERIKRLHVLFR